ncbi:unnamed protein product [Mycena citricolor]|uniref:Protein kinase domain-containing protein n=1 Tax=Mycena citricolor TaxID=2018698 RepID=A0AAD2Q1H8_9AGAR|nr:unnamed protein product [Mycena citricolor]CAK5281347.1 unnamed protein product [Mycena citricolor]
MLQNPISVPRPLSANNHQDDYSPSDYSRSNDISSRLPSPSLAAKRPQKEALARAIFAASPSPAVPLSISTNLAAARVASSSPSAQSARLRSPYISARQTASPVSFSPRPAPLSPIDSSSHHSSFSSVLEDVLQPGDIVGEGVELQGEVIHLVAAPDPGVQHTTQPAREFEVVRRLGAGSYAVVYQVLEVLERGAPSEDGHSSMMGHMDMEIDGSQTDFGPSTKYGREYAIKCLSKANLDSEALRAQMDEVWIHQSLHSHPNIVTHYRTLETSSFLLLLLEYVPGEDLFYFLEQARDHYESGSSTPDSDTSLGSHTPPTPSLLSTMNSSQLLSRTRLRLISSMFSQMCDAVAACHAQQVFHRDIKPENFIVTDGYTDIDGRRERRVVVKLTDFGLSTTDIESSDMDCGSAPYMSFECRNNVAPTYRPRAADVWSLGIVLINMLYHYNPWTDTQEGECHSFDLFRQQPVNFFMQRFVGMTRPVAEHLANRVFNVLDDPKDDSERISAADFGIWAKDLPDLLAPLLDIAAPQPMRGHQRLSSTASLILGHRISSSTPVSHRPSSRQASGTAGIRTPALPSRSLSRTGSFTQAFEAAKAAELSTVIDQEVEEIEEEQEHELQLPEAPVLADISVESRSASTNKRRKRGARKGKGSQTPASVLPKDETLDVLATASQTLAREISKASRAASASRPSSIRSSTTQSSGRSKPSSLGRKPFEPVAMYALPVNMLTNTRTAAPLPKLNPSSSSAASAASVSSASLPQPGSSPITKKSSKWKLSFGKNSGSQIGRISPVEEVSPPLDTSPPPMLMSPTARNVTNLLTGLDAPVPQHHSQSHGQQQHSFDDWARGRRVRHPTGPTSDAGFHNSRGSHPVGGDLRSDRATSPNSARSHRPVASSSSSMVSANWRSSTSSGTSSSAFTRYSNASVSTMATSVSANSWRATKPASPNAPAASNPNVPKNVKIITGIPWELYQLPRGQYAGEQDISGSPPGRQRARKPKDPRLGTIAEKLPAPGQKSPEAMSSSDLSIEEDGFDGPKKVQKGQINTLAKMLSALRR